MYIYRFRCLCMYCETINWNAYFLVNRCLLNAGELITASARLNVLRLQLWRQATV